MEHSYHVQREVVAYYRHIPRVPETFAVNPKLLDDLDEAQFAASFRQYADIMAQMYRDIESRPEAYGMLIVDIHAVNENKEDGNLAKASWRSVKRLGDVMAEVGKLGEIDGDGLRIPTAAFKTALKKVQKVHLILNRMLEFGFVISDYDGEKFNKGAESFVITFPGNALLMLVVQAYARSESFHTDDPHEFYYFDYKRVADRSKLPLDCVATDLAALLHEDNGRLLIALNRCFVDPLKLIPHYKDDSIEYYLKKKRVARFIIDFHTLEVQVILKLKNMDSYMDLVGSLPQSLRQYFERDGCHYCSFQNATEEWCKFRVSWTLDGNKYDTCGFESFHFHNPASENAENMIQLMKLEYGI